MLLIPAFQTEPLLSPGVSRIGGDGEIEIGRGAARMEDDERRQKTLEPHCFPPDCKSARLLSNLLMDHFSSRGPLDGRFERHFRLFAGPYATNEVLLGLETFTNRPQGGAAIEVSQVEIRVEADGLGIIGDGPFQIAHGLACHAAIAVEQRKLGIDLARTAVIVERSAQIATVGFYAGGAVEPYAR